MSMMQATPSTLHRAAPVAGSSTQWTSRAHLRPGLDQSGADLITLAGAWQAPHGDAGFQKGAGMGQLTGLMGRPLLGEGLAGVDRAVGNLADQDLGADAGEGVRVLGAEPAQSDPGQAEGVRLPGADVGCRDSGRHPARSGLGRDGNDEASGRAAEPLRPGEGVRGGGVGMVEGDADGGGQIAAGGVTHGKQRFQTGAGHRLHPALDGERRAGPDLGVITHMDFADDQGRGGVGGEGAAHAD